MDEITHVGLSSEKVPDASRQSMLFQIQVCSATPNLTDFAQKLQQKLWGLEGNLVWRRTGGIKFTAKLLRLEKIKVGNQWKKMHYTCCLRTLGSQKLAHAGLVRFALEPAVVKPALGNQDITSLVGY